MAKNKPMSTKEAAKKARSKASGKVEIDTIKKVGFKKIVGQKLLIKSIAVQKQRS
jgi:hypothetical protein